MGSQSSWYCMETTQWTQTWWVLCDVCWYLSSFRPAPLQKVSGFWSPHASPQTHASASLVFFCFGYETMSNCSQNCWIYWICAVLCFKQLFLIGYERFVRPLLATILCVWEIWSLHIMLAKKKKMCHRTDFEADRWPETRYCFFGLNKAVLFDGFLFFQQETNGA